MHQETKDAHPRNLGLDVNGYLMWIDGDLWLVVRGAVFGQSAAVCFTEHGSRFWPMRAFQKKLDGLGEWAWVGRVT